MGSALASSSNHPCVLLYCCKAAYCGDECMATNWKLDSYALSEEVEKICNDTFTMCMCVVSFRVLIKNENTIVFHFFLCNPPSIAGVLVKHKALWSR